MPETFFSLDQESRFRLLERASAHTNRAPHLLEKDVWVVWTLETLFSSELGKNITFKGGTSLSKAYGAIDRFSEDIDLTYDIRCILPEIDTGTEGIPSSPNQAKKWSGAVRIRLPEWIQDAVVPVIQAGLDASDLQAEMSIVSVFNDSLVVHYPALHQGTGYIKPEVRLEFGARATGEPCEVLPVSCDIASDFPTIVFPKASPRVMKIERTFWEKVTALHVFCKQGELRGEHISRHWYDVAILTTKPRVSDSWKDKFWLEQVVRHKTMFFPMKDQNKNLISYQECLGGSLRIVPEGAVLESLQKDYQNMVQDRVLYTHAPSFGDVLEKCVAVEEAINRLYGDAL